jgi:hypothetical protein
MNNILFNILTALSTTNIKIRLYICMHGIYANDKTLGYDHLYTKYRNRTWKRSTNYCIGCLQKVAKNLIRCSCIHKLGCCHGLSIIWTTQISSCLNQHGCPLLVTSCSVFVSDNNKGFSVKSLASSLRGYI